jgi:hypothetical protein
MDSIRVVLQLPKEMLSLAFDIVAGLKKKYI